MVTYRKESVTLYSVSQAGIYTESFQYHTANQYIYGGLCVGFCVNQPLDTYMVLNYVGIFSGDPGSSALVESTLRDRTLFYSKYIDAVVSIEPSRISLIGGFSDLELQRNITEQTANPTYDDEGAIFDGTKYMIFSEDFEFPLPRSYSGWIYPQSVAEFNFFAAYSELQMKHSFVIDIKDSEVRYIVGPDNNFNKTFFNIDTSKILQHWHFVSIDMFPSTSSRVYYAIRYDYFYTRYSSTYTHPPVGQFTHKIGENFIGKMRYFSISSEIYFSTYLPAPYYGIDVDSEHSFCNGQFIQLKVKCLSYCESNTYA